MGAPDNPDTIVIQNEYYKKGLTELQVWNHYKKYKRKILSEIGDRPVMLFIFVDVNTPIIRRFYRFKEIRLNNKNYEKYIHGRTVSIAVEQERNKLKYFCVDIDAGSRITEDEKKECVGDILRVFDSLKNVKRKRIISSANSYHVYGYLTSSFKNNEAVYFLRDKLNSDKKIRNSYKISSRLRTDESVINLDLSPMYTRGSHTVPWALARNGLICMDITKNWKSFNRKDAVI